MRSVAVKFNFWDYDYYYFFAEPVNRKPSKNALFDTHRSPARRSHIRYLWKWFTWVAYVCGVKN